MRFRTVGDSGLKVSEITCGNWLTHGRDTADVSVACVRAAPDGGITTFDRRRVRRAGLRRRNPAVSSAIVGMSRPEQVAHNAVVADLDLSQDVLAAIDAALVDPVHGDLVERSPEKTATPFDVLPAWRRP